MAYSRPAGTTTRLSRSPILAVFLVVSATLVGVLVVLQSPAPSSPSSASPPITPHGERKSGFAEAEPGLDVPRLENVRYGSLPDGVTVFDDEVPAVANLDPDLVDALRQAAGDAADDGVEFYVNSGWRSAEYQDQLLREAISEHGSEEEAARWVATAETSPHVAGDAIDIGHSDATAWLSDHGAEYGLCQIYGNEPWHYELRPEADDDGCPTMYADPTHDPRMQ